MFHFLLFILSFAFQPDGSGDVFKAQAVAETTSTAPKTGAPAKAAEPAQAVVPGLVADSQDPTGRFMTATEVRPILTATKSNWIATREWEGQDLVYVTHLWSWRCGLAQMQVSVNGGPMQIWPMPPCHADLPAPNSILPEDGLPYAAFPLGSVQRLDVMIIYDDLGTDTVSYNGKGLMIP